LRFLIRLTNDNNFSYKKSQFKNIAIGYKNAFAAPSLHFLGEKNHTFDTRKECSVFTAHKASKKCRNLRKVSEWKLWARRY